MTIGLTYGTYAPFQTGHAQVIDTMLKDVDQGIILIFDSPLTPIPLSVRAGWLRRLYPAATVLEIWEQAPTPADEPGLADFVVQSALEALAGRPVDVVYSSHPAAAHLARTLSARHRPTPTSQPPTSQIRLNPAQHRAYIPDLVYRDLIVKAVFLGAPSTGKSTIAEALATRHHTSFCAEYGREYWDEHQVDRKVSYAGYDEIAVGHQQREEIAFAQADRYCFIDTNAMTTYLYAIDYEGRVPPLLTQLASQNAERYDLFFLCDDDIPYEDTWERSGDQKRHSFQRKVIVDLETRHIPYIRLSGTLEERMAKVDAVLADFVPYSNFYARQI